MTPTFNGAPATLDDLAALAATTYGVFTNLPVRAGAAQGVDLHLDRLDAGARALFDRPLDRPAARRWLAQAADQTADAGDLVLRATLFSRTFDRAHPAASSTLDLMVAAAPHRPPAPTPLRLRSVVHQRHAPHLKHLGTFDLWDHRRAAQAAGYDDALFTDPAGDIAEAGVWNIGFHDGRGLVWPHLYAHRQALTGVTMQLLQRGLDRLGRPWTARPVLLEQLAKLPYAFVCNALHPVRPVQSIDAQGFSCDEGVSALLQAALATEPWERL